MTVGITIFIISIYFSMLFFISWLTGKNATSDTFFTGNRNSPWYIVAFGMIGASLSGVTFISVPGWVETSQFTYMQMVLGYLLGYLVIAHILMPVYYRLNLTSIYTYLDDRFGKVSYKTGAMLFFISRVIGSSFRLFLVANVLQISIFNHLGIPFFVTVIITVLLIWLYTLRAGIKTVVWTDLLQTTFMLIAVVATIIIVLQKMDLDVAGAIEAINVSEYSRIFIFDDWKSGQHFVKQFISGAFITIVMTGLDQDMMQKNLTCRNLREAQKNMHWFSVILVPVNLLFLFLGALLFLYANSLGLDSLGGDNLYPVLATQGYLPLSIGFFFMLGLIAAAYSSADSALTALTTSFTLDILNGKKMQEKKLVETRKVVHIGISVLLILVIFIFKNLKDESVIEALFKVAGYTYGPLLGLFAFGFFTKRSLRENLVPLIALLAPALSILLNHYSETWFNGYVFGFEILIVNGFLTFMGLLLISKKGHT